MLQAVSVRTAPEAPGEAGEPARPRGGALTRDVSQSSLLPRTRFPMVIWKYVLPLLQLEILVKG